MILDELFQETGDEVGIGLLRLFLIVAVNVSYCNILIPEGRLEMVINDRSSINLYQIFGFKPRLRVLRKDGLSSTGCSVTGETRRTNIDCTNRTHEFHDTIKFPLTHDTKSEILQIREPIVLSLLADFGIFRSVLT